MKRIKAIVLSAIAALAFGFTTQAAAPDVNTTKMEQAVKKAAFFSTVVDVEYAQTFDILNWSVYLDVPYGAPMIVLIKIHYITNFGATDVTLQLNYSASDGVAFGTSMAPHLSTVETVTGWDILAVVPN